MESKIKSLMLAVQKDNFEQFLLLLEECEKYFGPEKENSNIVNILCRTNSGDSTLHVAAEHGRIQILKYLVETKGALVDLRNHDRKTPLHDAAQFSQCECTEYLLQKGADVNAVKKADWTPLMLACTKLNIDVIASLLRYGADPLFRNKDGWNSFHLASREGSLDIMKLLVTELQDPSRERIEQLVNSRSRNGRKPLHTAALHGRLEGVEYLLVSHFTEVDDVDNCGTTPLMDAVCSGSTEIVDLLIRHGANKRSTNKCGYNCLHIAAEAGIPHMISHLIQKYGFDVSESVRNGTTTALDIALMEKQYSAANILQNFTSLSCVQKT